MTQSDNSIGKVGHTLLHRKSLQLAEMATVFAAGGGVLLAGFGLLGQSPAANILSIWLANLTMLATIFAGLRSRGQRWDHFGLTPNLVDPKSFCWIALRSLPVFLFAVLAFAAGAVVMAIVFDVPETADMSKYNYLSGNLGLTILALASVFLVSSFAEEVIYRGFLMTRIMELGRDDTVTRGFAVILSALLFGLVHSDWGLPGMVQASCMGAALGTSYLIIGRNLWVTILAHAYMDTILILQMYSG